MKKLALILLAAGSLLGTAGIASAQWYGGYGGGYYGGGYYGRPYYGEDQYRYRYYGDDDRYYRRRGYYSGGLYYPRNRDNPYCPLNWTIQDGVCKPYRGY